MNKKERQKNCIFRGKEQNLYVEIKIQQIFSFLLLIGTLKKNYNFHSLEAKIGKNNFKYKYTCPGDCYTSLYVNDKKIFEKYSSLNHDGIQEYLTIKEKKLIIF